MTWASDGDKSLSFSLHKGAGSDCVIVELCVALNVALLNRVCAVRGHLMTFGGVTVRKAARLNLPPNSSCTQVHGVDQY